MQTFEPLTVGGRPSAGAPGIEEYLFDHAPEVALTVQLPRAQVVVVAAKRPGQAWDQTARCHIEQARASYRLWGDVPPWDQFDALETTSHYIGYVLYATADGRLEREALTGRLVREQPEDVTFYAVDGRPLADVLAERLDGALAGDSRIGAIRPRHAACNAFTLEAFAAVRLAMMMEARSDGVEYVACQLRPSLESRVLNRNGLYFHFPRTEELLGLPDGSVRLNRANPTVLHHMFSYPGYFLDAQDLQNTIQHKAIRGAILEAGQPHHLVSLLRGSSEVGGRLRSRIVERVHDGVYSSVVPTSAYQDRAWRVLNELGAKEL